MGRVRRQWGPTPHIPHHAAICTIIFKLYLNYITMQSHNENSNLVVRNEQGRAYVKCAICSAVVLDNNKKRHSERKHKGVLVEFSFASSEEINITTATDKEFKLIKKRQASTTIHETQGKSGKTYDVRGDPEVIQGFKSDPSLDIADVRIKRHKKSIKCRCCGFSCSRKNFPRHLRNYPLCHKVYFNTDGSPRAVLLRLGIGTRWRFLTKYKDEYVLVKRSQLEILEDSFIHLYYKSRNLLDLIEAYKNMADPTKKKIPDAADEFKEFSANEAYKRAVEVTKCYLRQRENFDCHETKLKYLEKVVHSIRRLEEIFNSQYKDHACPESEACNSTECDLLSPECVSVLIDIEYEKELDINAAYQREEEILRELGIDSRGKYDASIFEAKIAKLKNELLFIGQNADSTTSFEMFDCVQESRRTSAEVEELKERCTEIRQRMLIDETKVYELELEIKHKTNELLDCHDKTARLQNDLTRIYSTSQDVLDRISTLEQIASKRRQRFHEHCCSLQLEAAGVAQERVGQAIKVAQKAKLINLDFAIPG